MGIFAVVGTEEEKLDTFCVSELWPANWTVEYRWAVKGSWCLLLRCWIEWECDFAEKLNVFGHICQCDTAEIVMWWPWVYSLFSSTLASSDAVSALHFSLRAFGVPSMALHQSVLSFFFVCGFISASHFAYAAVFSLGKCMICSHGSWGKLDSEDTLWQYW